MAALRYYYSDAITDFLQKTSNEIIGELALAHNHDINNATKSSWEEEIEILKEVLEPYKDEGSVYFEYTIPRMGRRTDVIVLLNGIVLVIEFKTLDQKFTKSAESQVWDYAIDLKNFHEGSKDRILIPILVAPREDDANIKIELNPYTDNVYKPLLVNKKYLTSCLKHIVEIIPQEKYNPQSDEEWAKSGYEPTPTIIEAAVALYENHSVSEITKHDGDIEETTTCLNEIIKECRDNKRKAICFITGVPGAGKTLIGLQTAIDQFDKGEKAVYLSGNFPLVEILQEALTRDNVRKRKEKYRLKETEEKPLSKLEAKSQVKSFIQMIHHYRDLYVEGTKIENGEIVEDLNYFTNHKNKTYIPTEPIAIFDEAQRAWTKEELSRFMKEKKGILNFPYSEPEYLISCLDRRDDWALIVCLIGNGQEINKGEAGLNEWIDSINRKYQHWDVYISNKFTDSQSNISRINLKERLHIKEQLHLSMSMRSFRAEKVSLFIHQLLTLNKTEAQETLKELKYYPIVITRDLNKAKTWLRNHARGTERFGLLASSKAERLKAIGINVRYKTDFIHWFLEDGSDIRSSNYLEDVLTEFEVQGLEIDWSCVVWDADLRLNKTHDKWEHYQLRGGAKWQNINKETNKEYQINAYRVLLTRARQGMVIVVPEGDNNNIQRDDTRNPEWYDGIYDYLRSIGIKEI